MGALEGLRILDMTQYEAGPGCTQALAWLGADVVKVESLNGDPGRGPAGHNDYFITWNSNKRSISIDLRKSEGRELLLELLPNYDVFIENYSPGSMERLDLGYDVMKAVNPGIIYARIKGYGLSGPWSGYKCFDMAAQAAAGAFSITGERDGPPMRPGPTMGDAGTGVQMALAITAAYVQKLKTGKGQKIEVSMQEAMTWYLRTAAARGQRSGTKPATRSGNGYMPTSRLYQCKGGGPNDYLFVMGTTEPMWENFCAAIGRPDFLEDPRFASRGDRIKNADALVPEISAWIAERDKYTAMRELCEAGVPASAVLDTNEIYENPHLVERGFVHEVEHPELGKIRLLGWAPRMSESDVPIKAAPILGQHSREVVGQDLGLSDDDIDSLIADGVIRGQEAP